MHDAIAKDGIGGAGDVTVEQSLTAAEIARRDFPDANDGGWIDLVCSKCGTRSRVFPADEYDRQSLHRLRIIGDWDWDFAERGPACPMCSYWRGGTYYLSRVPKPGEVEALAAYTAAFIARETTPEPEYPILVEPDEDAPDDVLEAWYAEEDEFDAHYAKWVGLGQAVTNAAEALQAFGYAPDEISEIGFEAIEAHESRRQPKAAQASV